MLGECFGGFKSVGGECLGGFSSVRGSVLDVLKC